MIQEQNEKFNKDRKQRTKQKILMKTTMTEEFSRELQ